MLLQALSYLFILAAFVVALAKNKLVKTTTEKGFVYYLGFVLGVEIIYKTCTCFKIDIQHVIYNIYDIVTYLFFICWYYKVLDKAFFIKRIAFAYLVLLGVSLFFENIFTGYLRINAFSGTILILVLVMYFYYTLLNKNEVVYFLQDPKFWISTGLLVFNVGILPVTFLLTLSLNFNIDAILVVLNVVLYSCFIKGFLCYQNKTN